MSYRTVSVKELLERLEDEPDNEALQASRDEIERIPVYETLIHEWDFVDFAKELAEECADGINIVNQWPYNCIDWKEAAEALKSDYMDIEIEGIPYLYRAY